MDNPGTNFLFTYADVHRNLNIHLKNARNGCEAVRFDNEKDYIISYLLKVFNFHLKFFYKFNFDILVLVE